MADIGDGQEIQTDSLDLSLWRPEIGELDLSVSAGLPDFVGELAVEQVEAIIAFGDARAAEGYRQAIYDSISPVDVRYRDTEVLGFLSERTRISYQAATEAALVLALADFGYCSPEQATRVVEACKQVSAEGVDYEEKGKKGVKKGTRHDIKALTNMIGRDLSEEDRHLVHWTATSYDIIGTAEAARFRDATDELILPRLNNLQQTLADMAYRYADTPQIGRTHGQHGSPITFGFAIAGFVDRIGISMDALHERAGQLRGKFSGATGAYNASSLIFEDPEEFERAVLSKLGLKPAAISTQIPPTEQTARLFSEYAVASAVMADLANDMRHLQRSEINETREQFDAANQTGSSAMPHKRNPISFENVVGLNRAVQKLAAIPNDNILSEHQRDLADSASARFYPEVPATVAIMATRLDGAMAKLEVDEDALKANLALPQGAIAAEAVQTLLRKYGHPAAHDVVRELAQAARDQSVPFTEAFKLAVQSGELGDYFDQFTSDEAMIVLGPEEHYTGIAAEKARSIASRWTRPRDL